MADLPRWWDGDPRERFWVEATDRPDIGANLKAPLKNVSGEDWRYGLFREAAVGDVVFHYDTNSRAITSVSRISGPETLQPILWAARGTYAKARHAEPEEVPGYVIPLADNRPLAQPLTLQDLRSAKPQLRLLLDHLEGLYRRALYFPFEVGDREVWPNQGYAFKLPADVVAAFPALAASAGAALKPQEPRPPIPVPPGDGTLVRRAAAAIDASRWGYGVGPLQWLRKELRGGRSRAGSSIFHRSTVFDDWAFHYGGRGELQFNIGTDVFADGSEAFRVGVAFSLEEGQSLTDWRVLLPRIRRFNDYVSANSAEFEDLSLWHFDPAGERSPDRLPGRIEATILEEGVFIFVGARMAADAVDIHACLRTFDRLLPLWRYVQDDTADSEAGPIARVAEASGDATPAALRLDACVETRTGGWSQRSLAARTLNVQLRHNEIQNRLRSKLLADGYAFAGLEGKLGRRSVDLVTRHAGELWFWEIKVAHDVRQCLREAIGQLLEYALWDAIEPPGRLIVVGEAPMTPATAAYLERLNARFPIPLEYRQFVLIEEPDGDTPP